MSTKTRPLLPKTYDKSMTGKVQYFGLILYPDECSGHKGLIEYIQDHPNIYDYVMIEHVGEPLDDEEETRGKNHVHFMYKKTMRASANSECKFWAGWVKHVEPISNPQSYACYMLHDTPQSRVAGKTPYTVDQVKGTPKLITKLFGKTQILRNLGDIIDTAKSVNGDLFDLYDAVLADEHADEKLDVLYKYQHMVICASNQLHGVTSWLDNQYKKSVLQKEL